MSTSEKEKVAKEKERDDNRERARKLFLIVIFLILLFLSSFGLTYSIYKGDSGGNTEITTDKIIFTYSDVNRGGSGINIINAIPTLDNVGKKLTGTSQYFDFSINATSKKSNINYKLLVKKNDVSTLNDSNVRIYLTGITGTYEQELVLKNFDQLEVETINGSQYYVLYEKVLEKGIENYSDYYRLRMWVKQDAINYEDKVFSINVDVSAIQVGG